MKVTSKVIIIRIFILFLLLSITSLTLFPLVSNDLTLILPSQDKSTLDGTKLFLDKSNNPVLFYNVKREEGPSEIFYQVYKNSKWSTPIKFNFPASKEKTLFDAKKLSNGIPMLIIYGDDTDYAKLFNIKEEDAEKYQDISKFGISQEELLAIIFNNRRLFFSMQINGRWTSPLPIAGTNRSGTAILESGSNNNALLLFNKDVDGNIETFDDINLYFTNFYKNNWTKPIQLTSDNSLKFGTQIKFVNNQYLITWVSDNDNNLETTDDMRFYYAVIDVNGQIIESSQVIFNTFQGKSIPALGVYNSEAVLLWSKEVETKPQLMVSYYNNNWSTPENTGLEITGLSLANFQEISGNLFITFFDNSLLKAITRVDNIWHSNDAICSVYQTDLDIGEVNYITDPSGNLHFVMKGFIPEPSESTADVNEDADGIYYKKLSYLADLTFSRIKSTPHNLNFSISNIGHLFSEEYQVTIKLKENIIKTIECDPLSPGETAEFQEDITLENVSNIFKIEIATSTNESNIENNKIEHLVRVLPDYKVTSVTRVDDITIEAQIEERKNIASAEVPVILYIQEGKQIKKIRKSIFNPNKDESVIFEYPQLADYTGSFKLIVEVNPDRKIIEDNYMNNKNTFIFNPLPDFTIDSLIVTDENIEINLKNAGDDSTENIELILTDNPEIVNDPDQVDNLLYYQEINFGDNKELSLIISKTDMNPIAGQNLYAMINPYKKVKESNMNNNFYKVLLVDGKSVVDDKYAVLIIDSAKLNKNGKLDLTISNTGNAPTITPKVQVLDEDEYLITQKILSVIKAGEEKSVEFTDLDLDKYIVRVIYIGENKKEITVEQVVEKTAEEESVLIEAENMQLRNYYIAYCKDASNKRLILTFFYGIAESVFNGTEGIYDIKVTYFDVRLGRARYKLYIDGKLVDRWQADKWTRSYYPNKRCRVERIIKGVKLKKDSIIKIRGRRNFFEPAYLDCIELVPKDYEKDKEKNKQKNKDKEKYRKNEKNKVKGGRK